MSEFSRDDDVGIDFHSQLSSVFFFFVLFDAEEKKIIK